MLDGKPISREEAKQVVDELYRKMHERWKSKVNQGLFMKRLQEGSLPLEAIRLYYRNWAAFVLTINTLGLAVYYKQIDFLKKDLRLMKMFASKLVDEFGHPEPPGHILVLVQTGKALGLTEREVLDSPQLPAARALGDFHKVVVWDGGIGDYWASVVWEEAMGYFSQDWREALMKKYKLNLNDVVYYTTHYEADLKEHEGTASHVSIVRGVLEYMLQQGYVDERVGFGLEYCAVTPCDLNALMLQGVLDALGIS
ncbi:MAG: iron-containing redox enzyme family protein [Candidatus Binatia bacterium]